MRSAKVLLIALLSSAASVVFPQQGGLNGEPYWMILEKGKRLFQEGLFGDALLRFEDAIRVKRDLYENAHRSLVDVLSTAELRRYGDNLQAVETHIETNKMLGARDALAALYRTTDKERLSNSVDRALALLRSLRDYPEAEYWKGEVFRVEGELGIALSQYEKALSRADVLEIPAESRLIRYKMAELRAARREYNEMERLLLSIIAEDPLWSAQSRDFARNAMLRTIASDGADRFLTLYRHASPATYKAHRDLGVYYYRTGRHDRAFVQLLFAFLIGATNIIDELRRSDHEYEFASFAAALDLSRSRQEAGAFIRNSEFFKTLYYLAASMHANGHRSSAAELWRLIRGRSEAGEWNGRSVLQLASPFIEPSTETP